MYRLISNFNALFPFYYCHFHFNILLAELNMFLTSILAPLKLWIQRSGIIIANVSISMDYYTSSIIESNGRLNAALATKPTAEWQFAVDYEEWVRSPFVATTLPRLVSSIRIVISTILHFATLPLYVPLPFCTAVGPANVMEMPTTNNALSIWWQRTRITILECTIWSEFADPREWGFQQ